MWVPLVTVCHHEDWTYLKVKPDRFRKTEEMEGDTEFL